MAEIFVSYTRSDRDWAFWIGHELDDFGYSPHLHEWEVSGGANIMAWMEARTDAAAHVLCVVSEKYLKAPYSSWERGAAQWAAATGQPNFALPVFVQPCEAPILFAPLKRCDLHGITEAEARARLKAFLEPARKPPRGPFPGGAISPAAPAANRPPFPGKIALSNVPIRVPEHFLGRDDALKAIETSLPRYEGRAAITAVHGLRGVGKTTLAAAYAEKHRGDYRATWWIRAQTDSSMRADLVALGVRLGWVGAEDKEEPAIGLMMERLRHEGEGILLIYDNAIDAAALKPHLPLGGAVKVLVTSNAHAWRGVAEPVEIRLWPKEIGADYLIARTGREKERAAAEALSEALGGLPLAHEQAAAYCERIDISLAEYRKRFEAAPARFLDDARHAPAEYHDGLTVAKTFALAINEAAKLHPAAEPLIVHAALLAPEPIPLFLFAEAREKFGEPLASALEGDGLDEAVAALRTFALIERETIADERDPAITTDTIRLHRLVREVAAARREGKARDEALRALVTSMEAVYPKKFDDNPNAWRRARRLEAPVSALVRLLEQIVRPNEEFESLSHNALLDDTEFQTAFVDLLTSVTSYQTGVITFLQQAIPLISRVTAVVEAVTKNLIAASQHSDAMTLIRKAAAPRLGAMRALMDVEMGRDVVTLRLRIQIEVRLLSEELLPILENTLGLENPHTYQLRNMLARLLLDTGNADDAHKLAEAALSAYEKLLGKNDPWKKESASITADALDALGRAGEAAALRARHGLEKDTRPPV
jgi:hypothetical protein